jgi:transcriptional regulator with XRE-family HTH domain
MATPHIRKGARLHYYIKEWMVYLDVSDEELANRMGVSRTTVWKRYTEQHRLTPQKVAQIADALDRHPKELQLRPEEPSLDAIAEGSTPEQRAAMVTDIMRRMKKTG